MCEIMSKVQCQDCLLYWEVGIENCTCGKCLQLSPKSRRLNEGRYDVLSIPNYVIKKGPSLELELRGNEFITKPTINSGGEEKRATRPLDRFLNSSRYRDSQTKIGWDENIGAACDAIASEDHSYVATRRSRNENSWELVLNSEGANGSVDQRDDFKEAKKTCDRLYREYAATTGFVTRKNSSSIFSSTKTRTTIRRTWRGLLSYWFRNRMEIFSSCNHEFLFFFRWTAWNWDFSSWNEQKIFEFQMWAFSLTGNSDSRVSDGRYTQNTLSHAFYSCAQCVR